MGLDVSVAIIFMKKKMFGSKVEFVFNVSFADRVSMFVESVSDWEVA